MSAPTAFGGLDPSHGVDFPVGNRPGPWAHRAQTQPPSQSNNQEPHTTRPDLPTPVPDLLAFPVSQPEFPSPPKPAAVRRPRRRPHEHTLQAPAVIDRRNLPILGQPPPAPPRPRRCELPVAHNAQPGSGQRTLPISPTVDARRWADAVVEAGLGSRPRTQVARRPGPRGSPPRLRTLTPAGARCRTPFRFGACTQATALLVVV